MGRYVVENDQIKIEIDDHGAELKSLVKKDSGTEYMWCADSKYWGRTSPVLFPFVGSVNNGKFRAKDVEYSMGQHGFARDMDFKLESQSDSQIIFSLTSSKETLEKYPYEFKLFIGYELEGSSVKVIWKVENPAGEALPFSIGGHPAFNCPIREGEDRNQYFVKFEGVDEVTSHRIENGVAVSAEDIYKLEEGCLAITKSLFDQDALVIENQGIKRVALCDAGKTPYLTIEMDVPLFGVWSPVGKNAPFICIEPWYGRCDAEGFAGDVSEREFGNTIAAGDLWERSYSIIV